VYLFENEGEIMIKYANANTEEIKDGKIRISKKHQEKKASEASKKNKSFDFDEFALSDRISIDESSQ
jgi:hypothetical protein